MKDIIWEVTDAIEDYILGMKEDTDRYSYGAVKTAIDYFCNNVKQYEVSVISVTDTKGVVSFSWVENGTARLWSFIYDKGESNEHLISRRIKGGN